VPGEELLIERGVATHATIGGEPRPAGIAVELVTFALADGTVKPTAANLDVQPHIPFWAVCLAVGMTALFWWELWLGGGLIGGDVYSYSLPQKVFLADALARGEVPWWNPLVGHGYPVLGESQTGALYPLHLVLYGLLDVQSAWNAVMFTHYIAAFLASMWCAQRLGLQTTGALLAALVYVYGWFPVRASLDWAILGGLYLPIVLGSLAAYWQTRRPRYAAALSLAIGLQLLGGHYQIAFLTWLLAGTYGAWRWWEAATRVESRGSITRQRAVLVLAGAFVLGVGGRGGRPPGGRRPGPPRRPPAGPGGGGEHEPAYGHIPPTYLSQVLCPWFWYDPSFNLDAALGKLTWLSVPAGTNRVEAHLYFGQLPWYLAVGSLIAAVHRWRVSAGSRTDENARHLGGGKTWIAQREAAGLLDAGVNGRPWDRETLFWTVIAVLSVIYATGWLMPLLRWVPGFNFFRGPGRAGLVTTFAIAILAGGALDRLRSKFSPRWSTLLGALVVTVTIADLWWFPRNISYATALSDAPIQFRRASQVRRLLLAERVPVRLYAPGANLPTLLGVSAVSVYLGLGPREYFDPALTIPPAEPDDFHAFTPARLAWLRQAGVTHILSFQELARQGWPVDLKWAGIDPLLNFAWGRFQEPVFLYRLQDAPGRVVWDQAEASSTAVITSHRLQTVTIEADSITGGTLVLKELAYPGWRVAVDGQPSTVITVGGMYRGVELPPGAHQVIWSYRPRSVYWGFCLSGVSAGLLGWGSLALARRPSG